MESVVYHINKISELKIKEEIPEEKVKRYALFPIIDEKGYEFYLKHEIIHWSETELEFIKDIHNYEHASEQDRKVFDTILAFFLSGDGLISNNVVYRFLLECITYEEQAMFISQLNRELMHAVCYGLAAITFKRNENAICELIEAVEKTECVQKKIRFMEKWMLADRPRYERLIAFACAEGIFFCALFAIIFKWRSKGWFPNFIHANEMIARDESLHRDYGAYLFEKEISMILKNNPEKADEIKNSVLTIIKEVVEIEDEFADYILNEPLEDLNSVDLKQYIRLITDNLLTQLSYEPIYNVKNPFTWLNDITMEQKGNFYEVRIGSYVKRSLSEVLNWRRRAGLTDNNIDVYKIFMYNSRMLCLLRVIN